jgi:hypothetical protein
MLIVIVYIALILRKINLAALKPTKDHSKNFAIPYHAAERSTVNPIKNFCGYWLALKHVLE